jgi:hypothetical protein
MANHSRKQVWELTVRDLEVTPVWEFVCEDEDADECTVAPVYSGKRDSGAMYVARADFVCANGDFWPGFVQPDVDLAVSQPCVFSPAGPMTFWCGVQEPTRSSRDAWYAALGRSPADIFPIRWSCAFVVEGQATAGTIYGFGYLDGAGVLRTVA